MKVHVIRIYVLALSNGEVNIVTSKIFKEIRFIPRVCVVIQLALLCRVSVVGRVAVHFCQAFHQTSLVCAFSARQRLMVV